nr:hypothetical protein [Tanacetum cinerariifolium]
MRSMRLSSDSSYQISRLLYSKTGCVLDFWWPLPLPLPTKSGDGELERQLLHLWCSMIPRDNNMIVAGLSDASVQIYDAWQTQGTFLRPETWDNNTKKFLELPNGRTNTPRAAGTRLHSNND